MPPRAPLLAPGLLALSALLGACAGPGARAPAPSPVPAAASLALAEARALLRAGAAPEDPALGAALEAARRAAPDWVAPERLADDFELASLRGVAALTERRRAAAVEDESSGGRRSRAAALYLAGRLEEGAGSASFARAARLDPGLAWAHHGLAFAASAAEGPKAAEAHQRRALALAREPWERAFFAVALARHQVAAKQGARAARLLAAELESLDLAPSDRTWLAVETALVELGHPEPEGRARGFERGLALLAEADPAPRDLARLVAALRTLGLEHDWRGRRLHLALAARPGRERELATLLVERGGRTSPLGLGLALRGGGPDAGRTEPLPRAVWFSAGRYGEGVEGWLARLPGQVLDADGLPREPRLAALVAAARRHAAAGGDGARRDALVELGEALIAAGWFEEAGPVADELAAFDLEASLELANRALAGAELVSAVERLAHRPRAGARRAEGWAQGGPGPEAPELPGGAGAGKAADDLDELLARLAPELVRANRFLGGSVDPRAVQEELARSPRITYGPFAQILHPGPRFSAEDQALGRGPEGGAVPGLAALMERLGRFATLGQVVGGGGPDGVVLRRLFVEPRSGEHLGVAWGGTIAWCEGADLSARAERGGARISGAAVHEGYWIDVEVLRPEHRRWRAVAAAFDAPADDAAARDRLERALRPGGLPLPEPGPDPLPRERARIALEPLLDQADRVRLSVLAERAPPGRLVGEMGFDELVECVALHEEGHLVDRAVFLPLARNPLGVARLILDGGFSVRGVQRLLEYRAQLVALCVAPDPRLPLVDVLEIGGRGGESPLEHSAAYRNLARDLVRELERGLRADPARFPRIDPDQTLVHQLHLLEPETLRALALRLARRSGVP